MICFLLRLDHAYILVTSPGTSWDPTDSSNFAGEITVNPHICVVPVVSQWAISIIPCTSRNKICHGLYINRKILWLLWIRFPLSNPQFWLQFSIRCEVLDPCLIRVDKSTQKLILIGVKYRLSHILNWDILKTILLILSTTLLGWNIATYAILKHLQDVTAHL